MRRCLIAALLLLSACQLTWPGGDQTNPRAENPIVGGAITVTPLASPPAPSVASPPVPSVDPPTAPPTAKASAAPPPAPPDAAPPPAPPDAAPPPAPPDAAPPPAQPDAVPPPAEAAAPAATLPKSASQIACEKQKGTWSRAGASGTMTCIKHLRDSGKQCTRDRDCEGSCLARSRTCAPFSPMFGCNEVLQDDGRRVTLCLD